MAKMTIRSTFALDPETVRTLARLANRWDVSKSEALRRIVNTAAVIDEVDARSDRIAALAELQERLGLDADKADAWIEELRASRAARGP